VAAFRVHDLIKMGFLGGYLTRSKRRGAFQTGDTVTAVVTTQKKRAGLIWVAWPPRQWLLYHPRRTWIDLGDLPSLLHPHSACG